MVTGEVCKKTNFYGTIRRRMILISSQYQQKLNTPTREGDYIRAEPLNVRKRIGSTVYDVEIYVRKDKGETVEDKVMRLIRNDLNPASRYVKMNMPQTGRLPERSSA